MGVAHAPSPVQCEIDVNVEPAHEAAPQLTPALACSQAPAPLQLPVLPHGGWAVQRACGSASPGATFEHVPALPTTLQAWHVPHIELPQQTPSTQKSPVRHSDVAAQGCPRRFLSPHRFVFGSQMLGVRQSPSLVQAALQAAVEVALHTKGAQAIEAAAEQLPTPSQVFAGVRVELPAGQDGFAHWMPAAKRRHEPLPSHRPSVLQEAAPLLRHVPCGSTAPSGTLLQVPSAVGSAHVWHDPLHVELQHTPCAQNFERHSVPSAQVFPRPLRPHEPMMQTAGAEQSPSAVQATLQTFVPQL